MYRKYVSFKLGLVLTAGSAGAMLTALFTFAPVYTGNHMYAFSLAISALGLVGYGLIFRARRLSFEQSMKSD